ncbi:putative Ribosomal RNA large subunit methyltransferase H, RlmH/YbeA [Magnetospirillum gryphiswaldense MSR-1 v2]|uniref:Ribosomal RNA large subunit methyltransferase H n=1 Tax=Magnetospirillum gryphiswaldense (strain DSM 6361 / JCM 21280 / NBRC 15271 / MSR-1) TaxID=431944 RepID=V6F0I4_MAGGM|nr:23S rRNA (pseudouridine(1915)-N(3))-methyltransferase RlmH [Magnetospirillum gryphiswaldense]CDK98974.1 putative Ribosomal RNA large subunit methyltransferase H, RlmH/YbeA [Magnetospirillum gryphiswaldense MSR-1 v2]
MRLWLAAVGRVKPGPELDLFNQYSKRLSVPIAVREVEEKRPLPTPERMAREADLLLATLPPQAVVVALDERGKAMGSVDFATRVGRWRDDGTADLAFVIGGADGHGQAVRDRAALLLSFGAMTWPHMLVRAMVAEQLWRAQAILSGHPYHRA